MNKVMLIVVIAAVVVGAGAYFMSETSNESTVSPSVSTSASGSPTMSATGSPTASPKVSASPTANATVIIRYTDSGYSPSNVTISAGTKVTFVNESSIGMWTASGPHPQHTLLPEFDALKAYVKGESYTFTFVKVGEWPFHNHLKPNHFGKITVK